MDIFTMIVIIVAIVAIVTIVTVNSAYRDRMSTGGKETEKTVDYLVRYLDQLESRMANLETIVIEKETEKRFANL